MLGDVPVPQFPHVKRRHGQCPAQAPRQPFSVPPAGPWPLHTRQGGSRVTPLTWGQLDLQRRADEGHQRGREVDGHVLAGDGHVHADQALGTGAGQGQACRGPSQSPSVLRPLEVTPAAPGTR